MHKTPDLENWTIRSWRVEPKIRLSDDGLDDLSVEQAPALWKDLTLASIVAVLLWLAAAAVFA